MSEFYQKGSKMDKRKVRSEKSKAALKAAFIELFHQKEPESVSVVDLCRKAGLNRSTFYAHYNYIDELIREVLWESVEQVFAGMGPQWSLPLEDGGVERGAIVSYLHRFMGDSTLRRFCTCANNGKFRNLIIRAHVELTLGRLNDPIRYYTAYYHNAGILSFILEWFNNGFSIPEESVVELIHEFSKIMYRPWPGTGRFVY